MKYLPPLTMVRWRVAIGAVLPMVMSRCDCVIDVISIDLLPVKISVSRWAISECVSVLLKKIVFFGVRCFSVFLSRVDKKNQKKVVGGGGASRDFGLLLDGNLSLVHT